MIVFLGVTGDVGSVVVPRLRAVGYEVVAPPSSELDLTNRDAVKRFFGSLRESYGIIFAAFIDRRRSETIRDYELNQMMVDNLTHYSRPSWMMFTSSIVVYGERPRLPIDENSVLDGEGLYAKAKQSAEYRVAESAIGKFPCLTVRLPGVFGGTSRRNQSLDRILENGLKTGEISLGSNGNILRDWVSAREVADFTILNVTEPRTGVVNFVRGESIKIDEYVAIALEVIPQIRHHRGSPTDISTANNFVFDSARLRTQFPEWQFPDRKRDVYDLARTLKQFHDWQGPE